LARNYGNRDLIPKRNHPAGETRRARAWRRPRHERQVYRDAVSWGMEGFEKEARGGQARREPAAFRSQKK
jgi:hypothetical protein